MPTTRYHSLAILLLNTNSFSAWAAAISSKLVPTTRTKYAIAEKLEREANVREKDGAGANLPMSEKTKLVNNSKYNIVLQA